MVKLVADWYNQSHYDPPYKTLQQLAAEEAAEGEEEEDEIGATDNDSGTTG